MSKKKRKYIKKSPRQKAIDECEHLTFEILKYKRGAKCELCGLKNQLGLFHILPKGRFQRLRFHKQNLLIAGWYCCHYDFHHCYYIARDYTVPRIKELCGEDYEQRLRALDLTMPKLTLTYLTTLRMALEIELKECEDGWQTGK